MNFTIAPKIAEPDVAGSNARAKSRAASGDVLSGASGGAFDGELKDAARRAERGPEDETKTAEGEVAVSAATDVAPTPDAGPRDMIGWASAKIAAQIGTDPAAADAQPGTGGTDGEDFSAVLTAKAVNTRAPAASKADGETARPNLSRLVVARQETHFEPTLHEARLVEPETAVVTDAAPKGGASRDILQLLSEAEAAKPSTNAADPAAGKARAETIAGPSAALAGSLVGTADRSSGRVAEEPARSEAREAEPLPAEEPAVDAAPAPTRAERDVAVAPSRPERGSDRTSERASGREADRAALSVATPVAGPGAGADPAGAPAPMARQVAERIIDAFPAPASRAASDAAPSEAHLRLRAGGAAMRTLTIRLEPEHLGTLEVSMRLRDGQLTLELAADRTETARALGEDRSLIRTVLEKAGFSVDEAAISIVAREGAAGSPAPSSGRDAADGGAARGGDPRGDPQSSGGERGGQGAAPQGERPSAAPERAASDARRPGSSVFL